MKLALALILLTTACARDETVAAYGASGKTWLLQEIDDLPFEATATLQFPKRGKISGQAPCNTYAADLTVPYPWFALDPIAATQRACSENAAEQHYFAALAEMTLSEVLGDTLLLSTEDGRIMLFKAAAQTPQ